MIRKHIKSLKNIMVYVPALVGGSGKVRMKEIQICWAGKSNQVKAGKSNQFMSRLIHQEGLICSVTMTMKTTRFPKYTVMQSRWLQLWKLNICLSKIHVLNIFLSGWQEMWEAWTGMITRGDAPQYKTIDTMVMVPSDINRYPIETNRYPINT